MQSNPSRFLIVLLALINSSLLLGCRSAAASPGDLTTYSKIDGWPPRVNTKFSQATARENYQGELRITAFFSASALRLQKSGVQKITVKIFKPNGTAQTTGAGTPGPFQDVTKDDFETQNIDTAGVIRGRTARVVLELKSRSYPKPTHLLVEVDYVDTKGRRYGQPSYITGIVVSKPAPPSTHPLKS